MKSLNLTAMAVDELLDLQEQISKLLEDRVQHEYHELESRIARLQKLNLSVRQLPIRANHKRNGGGKIPAKYRNPERPHETWAGRGKQPRWMTAAIKAGKKRSDFLIANGAHAKARKARHSA